MTEILLVLDPSSIEPEEGAPSPDRIVGGTPTNRTWNFEDDGTGLYSGIWESSPGEWRVDYTEWEFCHIASGVSVLTEDGKEPVQLKAGDSFVIRPGFRGTWRVVETTRKLYVIKT
ncbi:cupin domain-containing protein [Aureimonas psammosilenae]|uniref:cupin domain-containing protein n=1 Tax=Aureimonas psammosilenae TaxID=2495496 RepID=UPI001260F3E1|nr:cupin domain-containing protein [Aureimonas psammosilenae]